MNSFKMLGWAALATIVLMGLGAGSASATTLEVGGEPKFESVELTASLKSGTKSILKDTNGFVKNECTSSHLSGSTTSPYTGSSVTGPVSSLSFGGCVRPVTVHAPGKLEVTWIPGTTNGTVASEEAEVTVGSAVGTLTCNTGGTTNLGTLTGKASGEAVLDVNAVLNCGIVPSARWEATYGVTSPEGLGVTA